MKFHHLKSVLILSLLFVAAVTVTADDPEDEDDAVVEDAKPEEPNIPTEEKVSRLYFSTLVSVSFSKALYNLENDNIFRITLVFADWLG